MKNKLIVGDAIEQMAKLPENSIDSIVTDPPYGLEFMGKDWDKFTKGKLSNRWQQAGKPSMRKFKGHNDWHSKPKPRYINDLKSMNALQEFCYEWAKEALRVLKPGGYLLSFGGTRTYHRMACAIEDAGFEIRDCIQWLYGSGFPKSLNIGKQVDKIQGNDGEVIGNRKAHDIRGNALMEATVPEYKKEVSQIQIDITKGNSAWEGWGTALKPANEPIVVARKPLSEKNVALNVLKWGTAGINIDACRIEGGVLESDKRTSKTGVGIWNQGNRRAKEEGEERHNPQGRFPSNVILDEEAGRMLDAPSRFFYCAKASKAERNMGCEDLPLKERPGLYDDDNYEWKHGHKIAKPTKNNHPTVKPIKLMRYLVRLVTPPNGVVLDPFLGSGTTAIAAKMEGFNWLGIEREAEYVKIAEARIKAVQTQLRLTGGKRNGR